MNITSVSSPKYSKPDNSTIDCLVTGTLANGQSVVNMPFTAASFDCMPYGVELYNALIAGEYGEIAPYTS